MSYKYLRFAIWNLLVVIVLVSCGMQPQSPETVDIKLTEFGIESSITTFEVGKAYRFVITNTGALNHEFTIMPPMPTPPMEMEGHDMENMPGAILHIADEQLAPGVTITMEFTFTEPASLGAIEFACHLPGHYEGGMNTSISVNAYLSDKEGTYEKT